MPYSIPHLVTSGTHFDVGFNTGKEFEHRIKNYFNIFQDFTNKILPFIETEFGKNILGNFARNLKEKYPWIYDELEGLSKGANINLNQILAINMRVEILQILNESKYKDQLEKSNQEDLQLLECSDFYLLNDQHHALVHNEDASISIYETCYIVTYKIKSKSYNGKIAPNESFTAYCYPGQLPGNAFGFNSSGFAFSVNALLPKRIAPYSFPRQIISRIMLSAKNLNDLEDFLVNTPIAYGICINIGYFGQDPSQLKSIHIRYDHDIDHFPVMFNYELAPNKDINQFTNLVSKHKIISKNAEKSHLCSKLYSMNNYHHFNHYERIQIDECSVNSSRERLKRSKEIKLPETVQDLLDMAYDTLNDTYPIYRAPHKNYSVHCLATVLFDLKSKIMKVFVGSYSKTEPFLSILMALDDI